MEVKIPFMDEFKDVLLDGTKTWTSRTRRYGKAGDTFRAFGHEFEIVKVEKRVLWDVANHFKEEGCKSAEHFKDVWRKLHRRKGWTPEKRVYVHIFRRISV